MKVLLGLLVLAGALAAVLYYGGMFGFDPVQQAKDTRAAITPGMSWEKVAAISEPKRWRIYNEHKQTIEGEEIISYEPGPDVSFQGNNIAERLKEGSLRGGFEFRYDFHSQKGGAFIVKFDQNGDVEYVTDAPTLGTLLDG
jgi:hypothetical protein